MTNKEEMEFALQWIDDHVDDMGFLPAHLLAFAKDFIQAQNKSQKSTIPCVSEWVAVEDGLPDHLQTVWLSDGKEWTTLGCRAVYDYEGNWCWAEHNGVIYQDEGKIVAECDNEDLDVKYWMALPGPPCR